MSKITLELSLEDLRTLVRWAHQLQGDDGNITAQLNTVLASTYTQKPETLLYWYSFVFETSTEVGPRTDSTYAGYPDNYLTLARIREVKRACGMPEDCILLNACYMGHMTRTQMHT